MLIEGRPINDEILPQRSFFTFLNKKYLANLNVIGLVEIMSQHELFYLFTEISFASVLNQCVNNRVFVDNKI